MDGMAADAAAVGKTVVFLRYFRDLPDPRVRGANSRARRCSIICRQATEWRNCRRCVFEKRNKA